MLRIHVNNNFDETIILDGRGRRNNPYLRIYTYDFETKDIQWSYYF